MADKSGADGGLRELALFAGAGGGILGGHLLGWRTVCAVEWEPYAASVLAARQNDGLLPPFPIWDDVQTFDGRPWRGCVDVVSGGFPCQDISVAGGGAGIDGQRSGMWRHMARIVGEVRPRYVFVENSPALLTRGLGRVLGDLAALGYDCRWTVLGAADVGAPHQRDRFWLVARRSEDVSHTPNTWGAGWWQQQPQGTCQANCVAHTNSQPSEIRGHDHAVARIGGCGNSDAGGSRNNGAGFSDASTDEAMAHADRLWELQPQGSECQQWGWAGDGGAEMRDTDRQSLAVGQGQRWNACQELQAIERADWWQSEPNVGRVAHGVAARVDRLKAIGNGQVPLCAATAWKLLTA